MGVYQNKLPVCQYNRQTGEYIRTFESMSQAAAVTGTDYRSISQVCKGKYKTAGGYKWKLKEEEKR